MQVATVGAHQVRRLLRSVYCASNSLLTPETFVSGDAVKRAEAGRNKLAPSEQIVLGSKVE